MCDVRGETSFLCGHLMKISEGLGYPIITDCWFKKKLFHFFFISCCRRCMQVFEISCEGIGCVEAVSGWSWIDFSSVKSVRHQLFFESLEHTSCHVTWHESIKCYTNLHYDYMLLKTAADLHDWILSLILIACWSCMRITVRNGIWALNDQVNCILFVCLLFSYLDTWWSTRFV